MIHSDVQKYKLQDVSGALSARDERHLHKKSKLRLRSRPSFSTIRGIEMPDDSSLVEALTILIVLAIKHSHSFASF